MNDGEIRPLKLIEGIRTRPSMYVGSTDSRGLHQLVWGFIDDSVGEIASGIATTVTVSLHEDESVELVDNGRPIPVHALPEFENRSLLEVHFTELARATGTSARGQQEWPAKTCAALDLGAVVGNALSEWLVAEVGDGERTSRIKFERGRVAESLTHVDSTWSGCRIRFKADGKIFGTSTFPRLFIANRLQTLSGLLPGRRFEFNDRRVAIKSAWESSNGVTELLRTLSCRSSCVDVPPIAFSFATESFRLDVAFQYSNEVGVRAACYVNTLETVEGGSHWIGLKRGLSRAVNEGLKDAGSEPLAEGQWLQDGLTAIVSIWVDDPTFEGPSRTKFQYAAIEGTVESLIYRGVKAHLDAHPEVLTAIEERARA